MPDSIIAEKYPNAETTESGLKYVVTEAGTNPDKPSPGGNQHSRRDPRRDSRLEAFPRLRSSL